MSEHPDQAVIGVVPSAEMERRPRLFRALEYAFPARFEPREPRFLRGVAAMIAFTDGDLDDVLESVAVPSLLLGEARTSRPATIGTVKLARSAFLDPRLSGRRLVDEGAGDQRPVPVQAGDEVLASVEGVPVWLRRHTESAVVYRSTVAPDELDQNQSLRDALKRSRFFSLLPLIHFLRESCADDWAPPPPRAAFVIDDPNLHRPSYGYLDFREVAEHAWQHGYHVAIATVPIDAWLVHRSTAAIFQANASVLSLAVHGNNHTKLELGRELKEDFALRPLAQALRRVTSLEERTGLTVARVMVAPFEVCSPSMMRALALVGYDGLCYGWGLRGSPKPLLAGWQTADIVEGGLPLIPRHPITDVDDELVFRAYLNQPVIFYGHHHDLRSGLDVLAQAAAEVNRLDGVRWTSLDEIAASNFARRQTGSILRVRPYSRRLRVHIPEDVDGIVVEAPPLYDDADNEAVAVRRLGARDQSPQLGPMGLPVRVSPETEIEVRLVRRGSVDPNAVPAPPLRPWPPVRKLLTECRDRLAPPLARLTGRI